MGCTSIYRQAVETHTRKINNFLKAIGVDGHKKRETAGMEAENNQEPCLTVLGIPSLPQILSPPFPEAFSFLAPYPLTRDVLIVEKHSKATSKS